MNNNNKYNIKYYIIINDCHMMSMLPQWVWILFLLEEEEEEMYNLCRDVALNLHMEIDSFWMLSEINTKMHLSLEH